MNFDHPDLNKLADGAARSPFVAGLLGALVTAARGMPGTTWRERLAHSLSGAAMAGYLGPGAAEWFGISGQNLMSAGAFLVGMFGLNASAAVWEYLKTAKLSDWLPGLKKGGE